MNQPSASSIWKVSPKVSWPFPQFFSSAFVYSRRTSFFLVFLATRCSFDVSRLKVTQGRARLPTNSRGQHTPFASLQSPTNQLAFSIIWSNYGQRQIRSGEDDSGDEPWQRRCKARCPKGQGH